MRISDLPKDARFTSFEELSEALGKKVGLKQTKDKKKLKKQREDFCARHRCPACGEPMEYLYGTNIMTCKNQNCKGIKLETVDQKSGEIRTRFVTPYHTLDKKGSDIAMNIFATVK